MDGKLTVMENLADSEGLKLAYEVSELFIDYFFIIWNVKRLYLLLIAPF